MGTSSQKQQRSFKKRRYRTDREITEANQRRFKQAAWEQRVCAVSGDTGMDWEAHHVVEKRYLKANFLPLWDYRNALRVKASVHGQHTNRMEVIPLRCLTDENIEYAFDVMGASAYDYLMRLYDGEDPRVERAFEEAEAERLAKIPANERRPWKPRR